MFVPFTRSQSRLRVSCFIAWQFYCIPPLLRSLNYFFSLWEFKHPSWISDHEQEMKMWPGEHSCKNQMQGVLHQSHRPGGAATATKEWALREKAARTQQMTPALPTGTWRSGIVGSSLRVWRRPAAKAQAWYHWPSLPKTRFQEWHKC